MEKAGTSKRRSSELTDDDDGDDNPSRKSKHSANDPPTEEGIFKNMTFYIIPAGLGKQRFNLFKTQILRHGGHVQDSTWVLSKDNVTTHVVAEENLTCAHVEKIVRLQLGAARPPYVVKTSWISECLRQKQKVDLHPFLFLKVQGPSVAKEAERIGHHTMVVKQVAADEDSDYVPSDADDGSIPSITKTMQGSENTKHPRVNVEKFACAVPSTSKPINYNQHITDKLEALASTYNATQDRWRAVGYERAITVLKRHDKEITTWEDARSLPNIGDRLADKIQEILESGRLRKMEEVCSNEKVTALHLFSNIWGIGTTTAQLLVQQGHRTLEDLKEANLNRQQLIGLQHYSDFLDRMPREEATEIEEMVKTAALALQPGLFVKACGSYLRGKTTCGDVDILATHPNGRSHQGLLPKIIASLRQSKFLTDDLVASQENGNQQKYMGVCRLPRPNAQHRRLDIIVVPYSEYACARLYFTGSAHFNRSMRLLARKMGMSLSEHSLNRGVVRKGQVRLCEGTPIPTPTEESIFEQLGIPYRPPEERDH